MQQTPPTCRLCATPLPHAPIISMSPFPKAAQFYPTKDQFKDDAGITLDVFQCSACSLVQLSIEPVEYYKEVITAASLSPKAKAARLTEIETFVQTYHLKGKRALEIGCARGDMLDVIDEAGLYPTGLEFSPSSVDIGRKRGRTIHCDYINTYNPNEKADVFFSFNYMEHQPSPKDFIQSIHRVTSNDAMGYITVPNLSYLLDSKCLYEFVADHLVYFTPQTLRLAFENNGFDVLNCELINNNNDILAIVKKRTPLHIRDHIAEVDQLKSELNKLVNQYADHGKKIAVWGAGHRTLALLAISQINKIAFIVDSADFKQGKYSPIMFSKIVSPQTLEESDVDSIIIMVPGIYPDEVLKTVQGFARKLDVYMLKGNSIIRAQQGFIMKLSDYVAQKLSTLGIKQVFMITGGGAMHLNQSIGSHPDLNCTFNHHEQACAIAAESYFRLTNTPALVNVTTGPGGTNALTGVHGAWTDSLGMLIISGQVKYPTTVHSTGLSLRQLGDQEVDIVKVVSPITKYSVMITDPSTIRYHLEKALYLCTSGRPGPCWIDIPIDIQGAQISPDKLKGFTPAELNESWKKTDLTQAARNILEKIAEAKRPVIFAGTGVRLCGQHEAFIKLIERLNIPVVTGWNAHDVLWNDHPCYAGRPGSVGTRGGNFVTQNADLLLILGSRLNIRQVSYNWENFAPKAYKIWVDIDHNEMQKPTINSQMPIHADLNEFLPVLVNETTSIISDNFSDWLDWCRDINARYPVVLKEYWKSERINPYCFMDQLFRQLREDQITVCANGSACVIGFQTAYIQKRQRLWTNSGCASMGYDLPAAIGAFKASKRAVICLAGDGSIMMNLQELQTIAGEKMPIKIFLINNGGYSSIFQTHRNFFNGNEIGASPKSGVSFPDFSKLSLAFGLSYFSCTSHDEMKHAIDNALTTQGPVLCEVFVDENQPFAPKLSSKQLPDGTIVSPSLEDMSPFLPEDELKQNMIHE